MPIITAHYHHPWAIPSLVICGNFAAATDTTDSIWLKFSPSYGEHFSTKIIIMLIIFISDKMGIGT